MHSTYATPARAAAASVLESVRPLGAEAADVAVAAIDAAACADCCVCPLPVPVRTKPPKKGRVRGLAGPYSGLLGHEAKGRRRLVVDRGQGANVAQQLVQQGRLQVVHSARGPQRLVREHDRLHERTWAFRGSAHGDAGTRGFKQTGWG